MNGALLLAAHSASMRRLLLTLLFCMASMPAWAQKPTEITEGEMALLPPYCPDTQSFRYGDRTNNPSPNAPGWIARMGETFWDMHHFCWAQIRMNRARRFGIETTIREGLIRGAIADYEYVLVNEKPGFPLAPEVLTRLGEAYLALGATGPAMEALARARRIKPDYWPPYVAWANVLVGIGKQGEALALVEEVLGLAPNDPVLQAHYRRLSGKPTTNATKGRSSLAKGKPVPASSPPITPTPDAQR